MSKDKKSRLIDFYIQCKNKKGIDKKVTVTDMKLGLKISSETIIKLFGSWDKFVAEANSVYAKGLTVDEQTLLSEVGRKFDPTATKKQCIEDLRAIQKLNPRSFITRIFYRNNGKYSDSTWSVHFGTFKEFRKQAGLELSRAQHKLEKEVAKYSSVDYLRDFVKAEVTPYLNKHEVKLSNKRFKTVIVGSDFHDIDCDEFILGVFIDTCKRLQPDVIVLNGDLFDCYDASKYDKDVRQLKIVERFEYVKKNIFKPLRDSCPNSQIDFILGNHEWRIVNIISAKTPNFRVLLSDVMGISLKDVFGVDEFKINLISKMNFSAFSMAERNNELKKNYRIYYNCFVVGHFKDLGYGMSGTSGHCHRPSTETFTNIKMGKCFWVETGCICFTDAEYIDHRDKWGNSFLIAHIDTKEERVNPEHIIISGNNVVVHGVRYERKN